MLSAILVKKGEKVSKNQPLFIIEAMKMETTITAIADGTIKKIELKEGVMLNSGDLVMRLD